MPAGEARDFALSTLRHLPEPFLLIDEHGLIAFVNHAGERLLDCKLEGVRGRTARDFLNLREAHDLVHLETTATLINNGRLEFKVTNYPLDEATEWLHLALRFPDGKPSKAQHRPHAHSEASFKHIESGLASQAVPVEDDYWQGERLVSILDKLPTVVAAVSKDGAHVYQNRMAFETLGSIRWSQNGLTSWSVSRGVAVHQADPN